MYDGKYSAADVAMIEQAGVTLAEVDKHWAMFPDKNLDVAIGHIVGLKNGLGQERNEPFAEQKSSEEVSSET